MILTRTKFCLGNETLSQSGDVCVILIVVEKEYFLTRWFLGKGLLG